MKIIVAGGAGYIGSLLVPALVDHGYDVEVIDLLWFGNKLPKEVKVTQKNLFECVVDDFKGADQVVFLGGLSNDPMAEFSPAENFIGNAALPAYLSFISKQAGVKRFVFASTCSVYGYTVNELYDEESPLICGYPYGISKNQGESGAHLMQDDNFSVISLRQGTVSGHSPRMRFDLIVNTMFKCAMVDGEVTVNNPSIWRPIYSIRDCVSGFIRAIQADYSISGAFNVSSGNYTVGQVGDYVQQQVQELTGRKINLIVKDVQDFRNYKVTCKKAETVLGFRAQYDIKDIITELYNHKDEYGDFSNKDFYNIQVFKDITLNL